MRSELNRTQATERSGAGTGQRLAPLPDQCCFSTAQRPARVGERRSADDFSLSLIHSASCGGWCHTRTLVAFPCLHYGGVLAANEGSRPAGAGSAFNLHVPHSVQASSDSIVHGWEARMNCAHCSLAAGLLSCGGPAHFQKLGAPM